MVNSRVTVENYIPLQFLSTFLADIRVTASLSNIFSTEKLVQLNAAICQQRFSP